MSDKVRVYFKYREKNLSDPDWNYPRTFLPNVGDELHLMNLREDPYKRHWYTVRKRRWLTHSILEVCLDNFRYAPEDD